jgi:hypothetical protein
VTVDSFQEDVTGATDTAPAVFTRFTKTISVARTTWVAVTPVGSDVRSNWRKAVFPLPTYRLERYPKFVVLRVALT